MRARNPPRAKVETRQQPEIVSRRRHRHAGRRVCERGKAHDSRHGAGSTSPQTWAAATMRALIGPRQRSTGVAQIPRQTASRNASNRTRGVATPHAQRAGRFGPRLRVAYAGQADAPQYMQRHPVCKSSADGPSSCKATLEYAGRVAPQTNTRGLPLPTLEHEYTYHGRRNANRTLGIRHTPSRSRATTPQ